MAVKATSSFSVSEVVVGAFHPSLWHTVLPPPPQEVFLASTSLFRKTDAQHLLYVALALRINRGWHSKLISLPVWHILSETAAVQFPSLNSKNHLNARGEHALVLTRLHFVYTKVIKLTVLMTLKPISERILKAVSKVRV